MPLLVAPTPLFTRWWCLRAGGWAVMRSERFAERTRRLNLAAARHGTARHAAAAGPPGQGSNPLYLPGGGPKPTSNPLTCWGNWLG